MQTTHFKVSTTEDASMQLQATAHSNNSKINWLVTCGKDPMMVYIMLITLPPIIKSVFD